ncbi:hypothetical protein VC87395_003475A, partial [Vibrio paracholerae 87395]
MKQNSSKSGFNYSEDSAFSVQVA